MTPLRFLVLIAALAAASGCGCPEFDGLDGNLTFSSCTDLTRPVLRDSRIPIIITDEADTAVTTWTSDDEGTLAVVGEVGSWQVEAYSLGTAEVTATMDGVSDRLAFEVVAAASAELFDSMGATARDIIDEYPEDVDGDLSDPQPSAPVQLFGGQRIDLGLEVFDLQDRALAWSPEAVVVGGVASLSGTSVRIDEEGAATVDDVDGGPLLAFEVEEVLDLTGAQLSLAAWQPERPVAPSEDLNADSVTALGYLRAIVLDAEGRPIYQAPLRWTSTGPGDIFSFRDLETDDVPSRTDFARHDLAGLDGRRAPNAKVCASVSLETPDGIQARSAWLEPGSVTVYDEGNCDGQAGCACSAADSEPVGVLVLLGLLGGLGLSRRRRAAARPSLATGCRTGA